ncbi:MAG: DNA polymerase III subunit delta [Clostridia bacterium]|nr:DNA polymerase III subunit delta [Clostridia bacterium]
MSEIQYTALAAHIKTGVPSPVYLLCGDDAYLRRRALDALKAAYLPDVLPEFNYTEFDGSTCSVEEIAAAAETLPMMAPRRMVLVKDLDAAAIGATEYRKLEALLGAPYDTCVLIFFNVSVKTSAKAGDKQGAMRNLIKKQCTVVNCKTPSAAEIADILTAAAKENGASLSRADASYMVERCGTDITNLLSEIAKLTAMYGGKITRAAIDRHTTQSLDVKAYLLASNVIAGKRRDAFGILEDLFAERTEPVAVLAIMAGSFIDLYRAKLAAADRKTADDMPALFGDEYKGKEKRLSFAFRDSRRYSPELLRQWCLLLCRTDAQLKSSRVEGTILLEKMLTEMFLLAERYR